MPTYNGVFSLVNCRELFRDILADWYIHVKWYSRELSSACDALAREVVLCWPNWVVQGDFVKSLVDKGSVVIDFSNWFAVLAKPVDFVHT